jgi:hypothetical protein
MTRYFSHDLDGIDTHDTLEDARNRALGALDEARDESADYGWPEETNRICYGVLLGEAGERTHTTLEQAEKDGDELAVEKMRESGWSYMATFDLDESAALGDVLSERERRRQSEGDAFDDTLTDGTLVKTVAALLQTEGEHPRSRLVLCAAWLLAEIERLDRAAGGK